MINVTLEFATVEEAITALAAVRGNVVIKKTEDAPKADKAGKSDGAKATAPAPAPAPAPTASAPPAAAPTTQPSASTSQVGYAVIADKIGAKAKTHRAEVVALLKKFGANNGKELKEADYAKFDEEIDKIGAEALA